MHDRPSPEAGRLRRRSGPAELCRSRDESPSVAMVSAGNRLPPW
ncbi:hypothetical protein I547_3238 [Mycobacterium kansasii 824]|nr:hypothetical protein I547_3238 [Mycobacterium kansasii 824]